MVARRGRTGRAQDSLALLRISQVTVITTMPVWREADVKRLLRVPEEFAVAAVLALGRPVHQPTKLRRKPVADFATFDTFDGPPLTTTL